MTTTPTLSRLFLKRIQGDIKDLDKNRMEFAQAIQDENNIKLNFFKYLHRFVNAYWIKQNENNERLNKQELKKQLKKILLLFI